MNTNALNKLYRTSKEIGSIVLSANQKLTEKDLEKMETWAKDNLRSYDLLLKYKAISVEQHAEEVGKVSNLLDDIARYRKEGNNGKDPV